MTEYLIAKGESPRGVDVIAAVLAAIMPDREVTLTAPPMPPVLRIENQPTQIGQTAC